MHKFEACVLRPIEEKGTFGYWVLSKKDPHFIICRLATRDERQKHVLQKWAELHGAIWDFFKEQGLPDAIAYTELRLFLQTNFSMKDVEAASKIDE